MKSSNFIKMRLLKSFLLLFALLFSKYASAYDFMVDGLCYNKNNDGTTVKVTYQINDSGNNYSSLSGTLEIPATVAWEGVTYSVTTIGEYAFRYNQTITSVTIPLSVTLIDNSAFYNCNKLTSVIISRRIPAIIIPSRSGTFIMSFPGCSSGNTRICLIFPPKHTVKRSSRWRGATGRQICWMKRNIRLYFSCRTGTPSAFPISRH